MLFPAARTATAPSTNALTLHLMLFFYMFFMQASIALVALQTGLDDVPAFQLMTSGHPSTPAVGRNLALYQKLGRNALQHMKDALFD